MKKFLRSLVMAFMFSCCFSFTCNAEDSIDSIKNYKEYLLSSSNGEDSNLDDLTGDNKISVFDLVVLKRNLLNTTTETTASDTIITTETTTSEITTNVTETITETITSVTSTTTTETTPVISDKTQLQIVLEEIAINAEIPEVDPQLENELNNIFSFSYEGRYFYYTLLSKDSTDSISDIIVDPTKVKNLHVWEVINPENSEDFLACNYSSSLPDTTDRTFIYRNIEREYDLIPFKDISWSDIKSINKLISGISKWYDIDWYMISYYDYNLDGLLTKDDLSILMENYMSKPQNLGYANSSYVYKAIQNNIKMSEYVLTFGDLSYSNFELLIPTQAFINTNKEILNSVSLFQTFSISHFEEFSEKYGTFMTVTDISDYDFIIARKLSGVFTWVPVKASTFGYTGFYVYNIDPITRQYIPAIS